MSAIVFNNLKPTRSEIRPNRSKLYSDISLDMAIDPNSNNDILASFDVNAIVNSLTNILNTRKTENFLVPDFGGDLHKYLFQPISPAIGAALGEDLELTITKYEPRVRVSQVLVRVQEDLQQYDVLISLFIPSLGQNISFNPIFTSDGAIYINE